MTFRQRAWHFSEIQNGMKHKFDKIFHHQNTTVCHTPILPQKLKKKHLMRQWKKFQASRKKKTFKIPSHQTFYYVVY